MIYANWTDNAPETNKNSSSKHGKPVAVAH